MTSHVHVRRGRVSVLVEFSIREGAAAQLCDPCQIEERFTYRICHAPMSMLPFELIREAGLCERCGGRIGDAGRRIAT
jgi:hypothetical protein